MLDLAFEFFPLFQRDNLLHLLLAEQVNNRSITGAGTGSVTHADDEKDPIPVGWGRPVGPGH
jgi:hypothetical protein